MPLQARKSRYSKKTRKKGPRVRACFLNIRKRGLEVVKGRRQINLLASNSAPRQRQFMLAKRSSSSKMRSRSKENDRGSTDTERLSPPVATFSLNVQYPDDLFTSLPQIIDDLETQTSRLQSETVAECLPYLRGTKIVSSDDSDDYDNDDSSSSDVSSSTSDAPDYARWKKKISAGNRNDHLRNLPKLHRDAHVSFLRDKLGSYPWYFAAMDASRPWVFYWALNGLVLLGVDVGEYVDRLIYTLSPCQSTTGGFSGGHGQLSHLAPSYAAVLSLLITCEERAYRLIDRKTMWQWLGQMKQKDGGFTLVEGGEEDIRGAYCALTIISLLNLPINLPTTSPACVSGDETFLTGLSNWISECQTYEGGLAGAPGNEAHGSYTFCGLACLCIVGPPHETLSSLNLDSLISWLSSRQYAPEGGFAGRTNKLVDGCYSHWAGGCWALIEAALPQPYRLWSPAALEQYILCCCQAKKGGLRDKPSKPADAYHTCYNLAGLSSAQHRYMYRHQPDLSKSELVLSTETVATTLSKLNNSSKSDIAGMRSSEPSPPRQSPPQSESINHQPLFSSILDAPFYWHADADKNKSRSTHQISSSSSAGKDGVGSSGIDGNRCREGTIDTVEEREWEVKKDSEKVGLMHPIFVVPWGVAEKGRRYFERFPGFRT